MSETKYTPRHRALKQSARRQWKRAAALGATVPAAMSAAVAVGAPVQAASQPRIHNALEMARNQRGEEYQYGADGPNQFDCSGFVQYVYGKNGIQMPRTTEEQANKVRRIRKENMRPGDLMFYYDSGGVYHVAIFGGWHGDSRRHIVHAANEGADVTSGHSWTDNWFAGTMRPK